MILVIQCLWAWFSFFPLICYCKVAAYPVLFTWSYRMLVSLLCFNSCMKGISRYLWRLVLWLFSWSLCARTYIWHFECRRVL
uniref:Uncharacterized protein n=1 Tax=Rhizophora mucronata TaxID=61149 RepID=A0A2P2IQ86_RHIMU